MMGKNQSVGKGHTKWLGGPGCGPPVAHPCSKALTPHQLYKWLLIKLLCSYIATHTWVGIVMFIWFKVIVLSQLFNNRSSLQCRSW